MGLRRRIFLSHLLAIGFVVGVVALSVRSVAVQAVSQHMAGMTAGMMAGMIQDLQTTVARDITQASLMGAVAGAAVAVAAAYLVTGWIARPIGQMAVAARLIARGDYGQRVTYPADDDMGRFTTAFNDMAERLEETENLRRELLSTLSHELRTPLATIQGYMEGMEDGVIAAEPSNLHLVRDEATRLARLVTEIERLGRLEAGAERPQIQNVDAAMAGPLVDSVRRQFAEKSLRLTLELPPQPAPVLADEDKLSQVLLNLLANSLKYTEPGGSVSLRVAPVGQWVEFTVEDTGIGIPPHDLPHIFERFYRVDKSRSSATGGAGIGLAVVKRLVEQMHGSITAESEQGQFTRVTFRLPRGRA
jgi:signal transduction histidine kinase